MFVLTRRSALPRLRLVPGAVARYHDDRVTLLPVSTVQETELSVEPLTGGGYGVVLTEASPTVLAQYPSRRLARRQLHRLAGDSGWGWAGGLGRGLLAAALLWLVWFLFVLPSDPSALSAAVPDDAADSALAATRPGARVAPGAPPVADGPAFIDDPANPAPTPLASGAEPDPVLAR